MTHGTQLYEEDVRVPWVVAGLAAGAGSVESKRTRLPELFELLLKLCHLSVGRIGRARTLVLLLSRAPTNPFGRRTRLILLQ